MHLACLALERRCSDDDKTNISYSTYGHIDKWSAVIYCLIEW